MSSFLRFSAFFVGLTAVAACNGGGGSGTSSGGASSACSQDKSAEAYVAGMSKTSSAEAGGTGVTVAIESAKPAPPELGRNEWVVRVTDSSGNPISDATVKLVCRMVHSTLSHGCGVVADVINLGSGEYQIGAVDPDAGIAPILFNMNGHWDVTIVVDRQTGADAGKTEDTVTFSFCM